VPKAPPSPALAISQRQVFTQICSQRPSSNASDQPPCTTSPPRRATALQQPTTAPSKEEGAPSAAPHGDHLRPDTSTTAGHGKPPCPTELHTTREQRSTARGLEAPWFQATVTPTSAKAVPNHLLAAAEHRQVQIGPEDPAAQSPEPRLLGKGL
jgi:hypothetical protein